MIEVPAFAALRGAECLCAFGTWRADGGEGVPTWHEHLVDVAGRGVGAAELDGPDARAVLDRNVLYHGAR
jgi:hypothetical protein